MIKWNFLLLGGNYTICFTYKLHSVVFCGIFNVRLCRFCVVIWFFIPATTANDLRPRRIFYPRCYPLHLFSYLTSWERASIFPFECSVLKKGTTGTIFIKSLVWRGSWLGIEPGRPELEASTLPLGYRGGSTDGDRTDSNRTDGDRTDNEDTHALY